MTHSHSFVLHFLNYTNVIKSQISNTPIKLLSLIMYLLSFFLDKHSISSVFFNCIGHFFGTPKTKAKLRLCELHCIPHCLLTQNFTVSLLHVVYQHSFSLTDSFLSDIRLKISCLFALKSRLYIIEYIHTYVQTYNCM